MIIHHFIYLHHLDHHFHHHLDHDLDQYLDHSMLINGSFLVNHVIVTHAIATHAIVTHVIVQNVQHLLPVLLLFPHHHVLLSRHVRTTVLYVLSAQ